MLFAALTGISHRHLRRLAARARWPDRLAALGAYLGVSFPVYWVGLLLILVFAVTLRWLPPSGARGPALPRSCRRSRWGCARSPSCRG